ncbi:hypothetical protein F5050DRAFT_1801422 [Lentinula boryana]|uniref:Uncharacterized protein n=1 Tax=Lentinula boryana TaxID=40481 RepID=A0ABQ8Q3X7_9AGAR|nr:hypothetical protein F5050DRAFT_1801422 [Lentinula boryana]
MSEDDRAVKAARAKAMLKKRQAKKHGTPPSHTSGVISPVSERAFSPAPQERRLVTVSVDDQKQDLSDVFTGDDNADASWLSTLPRASSPPPAPPPTAVVFSESAATSPNSATIASANSHPEEIVWLEKGNGMLNLQIEQLSSEKAELQKTGDSFRTQNETLNAELGQSRAMNVNLKSENQTLKAELERMEKTKSSTSELEQTEAVLEKQYEHSAELEQQIQQLQAEMEVSLRNEQQTISLLVSEKAALTSDLERLSGAESDAQEAERMLLEEQSKTADLEEHLQQLRSELQDSTNRIQSQELTERELADKVKDQERQLQIANGSLISTRKEAEKHRRRARELEEQIESDDRADRLEASLKNTQDRADDLEFQLSKLKQTHSALKSERDELESRIRTVSEGEDEWKTKHIDLQTLHQNVEAQLAQTIAEKKDISNEKSSLQAELDTEQLTNAATELMSSTKHLQTVQNEAKIANRRAEDAERTQKELQEEGTNLMHSLNEMRPKIVELTGIRLELTEKASELERVIQNQESTIGQLGLSLEEARADAEASEKRLRDLLSEREKERLSAQDNDSDLQKAHTQLQLELDSAVASVRSFEADRAMRRNEAMQHVEEIARLEQLASTQSEELAALQHEIFRRQNDQSEDRSFLEVAQNEIESLRQEVALKDEELERLRLRTSISSTFPDKPHHSLKDELNDEVLSSLKLELSSSQSHVRSLEESLFDAEARSHALVKQVAALEDQLSTNQMPSRRPFSPLGGALPSRPSSRGSRPHSISGSQSLKPSTLARSAIEHNLSPETRHKRKTSLTMLKARIDSELAAASSRKVSDVGPIYSHHRPRPQFMDDSHVFWCSSCRGDLVIL